jgi:cytochrome P450
MTTTEAINIVDPAIYEQGIPHETFRWMRHNAPVYRHEYADGDFWAVTRYNDIIQVTRDWETFSSAKQTMAPLATSACATATPVTPAPATRMRLSLNDW